ncbi:uncharacterized protein LOC143868682 [Tasmannia lanceolata]|uniref:uncharacterized protein LOC143868682 n=1 Tax=Tasmannia lanceolata TaxID=3420 RepID=UPI0040644C2C
MAESDLMINRRAQQERERREQERKIKENLLKIQATTGPPTPARKKRGLNFHEPGTFIQQAEQLRKKAKLEALKKKIEERAAKTGINDAVKLATLTTNKVVEATTASTTATTVNKQQPTASEPNEEEVPDFEWWDKPLLKGRSLDEVVTKLVQNNTPPEEVFKGITNLVEHPPMRKPPGPDLSVVQVPIFLTPKERKKLRRQNRKIAESDKRERIKYGLIPKPEAKLKRSNIMYALADEAVVNPSMAEQLVREQVDKRQQAHIEHNEAKKLTLEQKRAKKLKKIQEDLSQVGTWVAVYRVLNLTSEAHKFKVTKNAKQLTMTGVVILYKDLNLVVVEGGPKQQRKFKKLMIDRIQWTNPTNDTATKVSTDVKPTQNYENNKCLLLWEGQVPDRSFVKFKVKQMNNELEIRDLFKQANVEHYWDLAFKMSILETINEP